MKLNQIDVYILNYLQGEYIKKNISIDSNEILTMLYNSYANQVVGRYEVIYFMWLSIRKMEALELMSSIPLNISENRHWMGERESGKMHFIIPENLHLAEKIDKLDWSQTADYLLEMDE